MDWYPTSLLIARVACVTGITALAGWNTYSVFFLYFAGLSIPVFSQPTKGAPIMQALCSDWIALARTALQAIRLISVVFLGIHGDLYYAGGFAVTLLLSKIDEYGCLPEKLRDLLQKYCIFPALASYLYLHKGLWFPLGLAILLTKGSPVQIDWGLRWACTTKEGTPSCSLHDIFTSYKPAVTLTREQLESLLGSKEEDYLHDWESNPRYNIYSRSGSSGERKSSSMFDEIHEHVDTRLLKQRQDLLEACMQPTHEGEEAVLERSILERGWLPHTSRESNTFPVSFAALFRNREIDFREKCYFEAIEKDLLQISPLKTRLLANKARAYVESKLTTEAQKTLCKQALDPKCRDLAPLSKLYCALRGIIRPKLRYTFRDTFFST
ncbi:MAG: hypothetical protein AAGF04_05645 [Chlamydiota bacterium]